VKVLADIDEAERSTATGAAPRGRVHINVNVPFGLSVIRILNESKSAYPRPYSESSSPRS
jgi:hypothetical protein